MKISNQTHLFIRVCFLIMRKSQIFSKSYWCLSLKTVMNQSQMMIVFRNFCQISKKQKCFLCYPKTKFHILKYVLFNEIFLALFLNYFLRNLSLSSTWNNWGKFRQGIWAFEERHNSKRWLFVHENSLYILSRV